MSWWPKLNERQLVVLRRVAEVSEPVTSMESALACTVYALRGRRLVTTPRAGGVWTAVITDAGRFYLEHGRYADASPRQRDSPPATRQARAADRSGRGNGDAVLPPGVPRTPSELLQRLQDSGGVVRVESPSPTAQGRAARVQSPVPSLRSAQAAARGQARLIVQESGTSSAHRALPFYAHARRSIQAPDNSDQQDTAAVAAPSPHPFSSLNTKVRATVIRLIAAHLHGSDISFNGAEFVWGVVNLRGRHVHRWQRRLQRREVHRRHLIHAEFIGGRIAFLGAECVDGRVNLGTVIDYSVPPRFQLCDEPSPVLVLPPWPNPRRSTHDDTGHDNGP